ncbi:MAG: RNA degradosome polyphosphate kinase [Acidimicrobiia bacterium]
MHARTSPNAVEAGDRYLNRELSWLDFNTRVLTLAADPAVPLLERVKFLAIFSNNLDEFFQVRVAALKGQVAAGVVKASFDGRPPARQLVEISDRVEELVAFQEQILTEMLVPQLAESGISLVTWSELEESARKTLVEFFDARIFPVLTPLAVDPAHPFPYISNLSLNLAVTVIDPHDDDDHHFARVKVPPSLPRFIPTPDGNRFVRIEEVLAAQLHKLFPGMLIVDAVPFRVTRNADLTVEDEEADDLLAAIEMELRRRRFGRAVRLEVDDAMSGEVLELLLSELDLDEDDVSRHHAPLDLNGLMAIAGLDRPDLKDPPWQPVDLKALSGSEDRRVFDAIAADDILVHHPYESFTGSVQRFIQEAADDPHVLTIKMTLYRTSGDSPIVEALIRAAENGKQVAALVELKARFDEQRNIAWAKALERAGVHVAYGLVGLKTHAKTVLVVREEGDTLRRYCHIGTGNYNPSTARLYEDIGLFTCDPAIGADVSVMFNHLTGYGREVPYQKLLVAPHWLRNQIRALIANEARHGTHGRIRMKMNSLVDPGIIDALYDASASGVAIDLVVRGICCLRPGVAGLSETIRVRSIVGRYLEHARVFEFANGVALDEPAFYIGSADMMQRNLDGRVEVLVPIERPALQAALREILDVNLADDQLAWHLDADGVWSRVATTDRRVETHQNLQYLTELRRTRSADGPR